MDEDGLIYDIEVVSIECMFSSWCTLRNIICKRFIYLLSPARSQQQYRRVAGAESINITLAHWGLLGSAPVLPEVAIPFQTLEIFHQLHRVCPCLSVDAFAKALHHLHRVSHATYDCWMDIF